MSNDNAETTKPNEPAATTELERRLEAAAATIAAATETKKVDRRNLKNEILYSLKIADDYAEHYRKLELGCAFIGVLFGFTAMTSLPTAIPAWAYGIIGFISASVSLLSVVFGFAGKASDFEHARVFFTEASNKVDTASDEELVKLNDDVGRMNVAGQINSVTDAIANNWALEHLDYEVNHDDLYDIGFLAYHTRFIGNWRKLKRFKELKK